MRLYRAALTILLIAAALTAAACAKRREPPPQHKADIDVADDKLAIQTAEVGEEEFHTTTTYVLVDAANRSDRDLLVTLRGDLIDAGGAVVGTLRPQLLRIPGRAVRMFALVDSENRAVPSATSARIEVLEAIAPTYPSTVDIRDGHVYQDGDRLVVQGAVANTADRRVTTIVFWGFYDRDGRPVKQMSTKLSIDGGQQRGVQMVGPPGAARGYMFVGEYTH